MASAAVTAVYDAFDPGDLLGMHSRRRLKRSTDALNQAKSDMDRASEQNRQLLDEYLKQSRNTYSTDAADYAAAKEALTGLKAYTPKDFEFGKTEQDYFDKFYNQRVNAANRAIREQSDGLSSSYLNQLAAKQQALATDAWSTALDKYNAARSQALSEYTAQNQAKQTGYQNQRDAAQTAYDIANTARNQLQDVYGNYYSQLANQNNIAAQNAAQLATATAQAQNTNDRSFLGRIFG
nr:MAG TPA: hypothetical protein [Caudoviricetes sp.]